MEVSINSGISNIGVWNVDQNNEKTFGSKNVGQKSEKESEFGMQDVGKISEKGSEVGFQDVSQEGGGQSTFSHKS
ncbi:MAG: hypothetical protein V3V70_06325 [Candidatus Scalindua sp.]|jgi:hypothetical protein